MSNTKASSTLNIPHTSINWRGWAFALASPFCFSVAPTAGRSLILGGMDPSVLLLLRFTIAGILLIGTTYLTNPTKLRIDQRGLFLCMGVGIITSGAMLCLFAALAFIEASMSSMILALMPVGVLSILALRGEKLTYRHLVRLALALVGVYLLIGPGGTVNLFGVILTLIGVMLFALTMALTQWYLHPYDSRTIVLYTLTTMTIIMGGWWLAQGAPWQAPGLSGWISIGLLAIVATFFARLTLYTAIRHIGSGQVSLLMPLETLLGIIWSMLFLNERLTAIQWFGGILILASALLAINRMRTRPAQ